MRLTLVSGSGAHAILSGNWEGSHEPATWTIRAGADGLHATTTVPHGTHLRTQVFTLTGSGPCGFSASGRVCARAQRFDAGAATVTVR